MPRLTTLDEVLFPVEEHPVFVSFTEKGSEKGSERRLAVPGKKAIINRTTHRVIGIVSRGCLSVLGKKRVQDDVGQGRCLIVT